MMLFSNWIASMIENNKIRQFHLMLLYHRPILMNSLKKEHYNNS